MVHCTAASWSHVYPPEIRCLIIWKPSTSPNTHTHTLTHTLTHSHTPSFTLLNSPPHTMRSCRKSLRSCANNAGQWAAFGRLSAATPRGVSKLEKSKISSQLFWPCNSPGLAIQGQNILYVAFTILHVSINEITFRNLIVTFFFFHF